MKTYFIYKHTSPSGYVYIGQTCLKPHRRWKNGHGYDDSQYFSNAIKKYGWDNIQHEILYEGLSKNEADEIEIKLIEHYKRLGISYNISPGGANVVSEEVKLKIGAQNKGRIIINNGEIEKHIYPNELNKYLSAGWVRGVIMTVARKNANRSFNVGRVPIHKDGILRRVFLSELDKYLSAGWVRGLPQQSIEKLKRRRGKSNTQDKIRIYKNGCSKYIQPDKLNEYLSAGWVRGLPVEIRQQISNTIKRRVKTNGPTCWIYDSNGCKLIKTSQLYMYINNGWHKGMGPFGKQKAQR